MRIFNIAESKLNAIVEEQVKYGVISIPFTYDRMGYRMDIVRRIRNIVKGKVAEEIFYQFSKEIGQTIGLNISVSQCQTPFYKIDKRDFVWQNIEWDIKNNFVLLPFNKIHFDDLPALVPSDQWSKRNQTKISGTSGVGFFFTFMEKSSSGEPINIVLSDSQDDFLRSLYRKYDGKEQENAPYSESWFFNKFGKINYTHRFEQRILIAGYCHPSMFSLFHEEGGKNYCNGAIHTKIYNYVLECGKLKQI